MAVACWVGSYLFFITDDSSCGLVGLADFPSHPLLHRPTDIHRAAGMTIHDVLEFFLHLRRHFTLNLGAFTYRRIHRPHSLLFTE